MTTEGFFSTADLAEALAVSQATAWRVCREHPGFSIRLGGRYKVPARHVDLVRRGETPADIAAKVRAGQLGPSQAA